jgi:hypothetical protein
LKTWLKKAVEEFLSVLLTKAGVIMKLSRLFLIALSAVLLLGQPQAAFAYVGPGAGITIIGSALALLAGIALAIVGFVWYPIKRLLRSRSGTAGNAGNVGDVGDVGDESSG